MLSSIFAFCSIAMPPPVEEPVPNSDLKRAHIDRSRLRFDRGVEAARPEHRRNGGKDIAELAEALSLMPD